MNAFEQRLADLGLDPIFAARAQQVCQAITPHVQEALRASGITDADQYHVAYTPEEIPHVR